MSVINVKKAIILLYLGKAELVAAQDGLTVRAVSIAMPFPSIVRLSVYVRVPYKRIILSRKNILRRDGHRCQFCGRSDVPLTVDHIVPVSRGGEETWENLVCACVGCNNKKGDRTPDEARMPLRRKYSMRIPTGPFFQVTRQTFRQTERDPSGRFHEAAAA